MIVKKNINVINHQNEHRFMNSIFQSQLLEESVYYDPHPGIYGSGSGNPSASKRSDSNSSGTKPKFKTSFKREFGRNIFKSNSSVRDFDRVLKRISSSSR